MHHGTFTSRDAAICGGFAIAEAIIVIAYIIIASIRLRKKIISMGRLIPSLHVIVVGGTIPPLQTVQPQPGFYPSQQVPLPPPQPGFYPPQEVLPPQPGFYPIQDYPPPYEQNTKP